MITNNVEAIHSRFIRYSWVKWFAKHFGLYGFNQIIEILFVQKIVRGHEIAAVRVYGCFIEPDYLLFR